jgi:opacity protein-like surface antigen
VKQLLLLAVAVALAVTPALAEWGGEVNLFLGEKKLSDDNLDDLEDETDFSLSDQFEWGIASSFGNVDWPVMIAVDLLMADSDDSYTYEGFYDYTYSVEIETTELAVGVRKFWAVNDKFEPYVGGGLAYVKAEACLEFTSDAAPFKQYSDSLSFDENDIGYWINGGGMWRFNDKFHLGIDVRYSDAKVDFDDVDLEKQPEGSGEFEAGGFHYGILFGYRW